MKDLNLLYVFEALWQERSVTASSERLGLTQAAVSGSLKRLRQAYDDQLFTLVGRRMEPTPRAVELSSQLLEALSIVRRTGVEQSRFDPTTAKRMFTVRTRDIGEVVCFPRILEAMTEKAPGTRLRTVFQPIPETMHGLANGQIDFALGFLPSLETAIHRRLLFTQHYVCAMRADHPLAKSDLTVERFRECEHLLVEYSGSGHQQLERALVETGVRLHIKLRLPQYLAAPHFVIRSDLLWSVPAILVETLVEYFPLVIKPHPLVLPEFEIALYWHDRYHRDPANKWLRELIVEELTRKPQERTGIASKSRRITTLTTKGRQ